MSNKAPDDITVCSNCGKGGEGDNDIQLKTCTACKMVKYCSRECQIAHRPQHKKECKKRVKELHEEALFKQPPPKEECPICFLPLPYDANQSTLQLCCGKTICNGCFYAMEIYATQICYLAYFYSYQRFHRDQGFALAMSLVIEHYTSHDRTL